MLANPNNNQIAPSKYQIVQTYYLIFGYFSLMAAVIGYLLNCLDHTSLVEDGQLDDENLTCPEQHVALEKFRQAMWMVCSTASVSIGAVVSALIGFYLVPWITAASNGNAIRNQANSLESANDRLGFYCMFTCLVMSVSLAVEIANRYVGVAAGYTASRSDCVDYDHENSHNVMNGATRQFIHEVVSIVIAVPSCIFWAYSSCAKMSFFANNNGNVGNDNIVNLELVQAIAGDINAYIEPLLPGDNSCAA